MSVFISNIESHRKIMIILWEKNACIVQQLEDRNPILWIEFQRYEQPNEWGGLA